MSYRIDIDGRGAGQAFAAFEAFAEARMQRAMLAATHRGAQRLKSSVRTSMQAAGLGRLGNAIDATSDQEKGRGVHPLPGGFSASGVLYVRTGSKRTRGALEAYIQGAEITPVRGRYLWVPTDQIRRLAKDKTRLTPATWSASGLDKTIGPLVLIRSVSGQPLLVVKNVGVSLAGLKRSAKSLTKKGAPRKGQVAKDFVVAFIAIPRTSRAARIDIEALHRAVMADLPATLASELRRA